jgi:hypothetical protein
MNHGPGPCPFDTCRGSWQMRQARGEARLYRFVNIVSIGEIIPFMGQAGVRLYRAEMCHLKDAERIHD